MKKIIIAALAASAFAAPALAQPDAPFTGARVEGLVGYDNIKGDGGHRNGVAYGAGVGYDFQMGGAVLGVEGEAMDSTAKGCDTGFVTPTDRICANAKRDLYVGGRVGVAVAPRTLLYAKAGYANTRFKVNYTDTATPANNTSASRNYDGLRVGGGVEQKLSGNVYAKAEYRYTNYEKGLSRHQVLGGVGIRF